MYKAYAGLCLQHNINHKVKWKNKALSILDKITNEMDV